MKRVLMIAPSSFPVVFSEAIVNINLLRVLSQSGEFEIDLISRENNHSYYPSDCFDTYGIHLRSLKVIQVDRKKTVSNMWLFLRSLFIFGIFSWDRNWAVKTISYIKRNFIVNNYDYVLTKNSPSLLVGRYLQRKYKLKWVASWNDPYPANMFPQPYGKGYEYRGTLADNLLINKMRHADIHIFPCTRLMHYMQKYMHVDKDKCMVIAHMNSFDHLKHNRIPDNTLRMIYSGNLVLPRDPVLFLKALKNVLDKNTDFKIQLSIMGHLTSDINEWVMKFGLDKVVSVLPPVEYKKSLELLSDFDVAVIIEAPVEEGIFLPTKVGDYVKMGMPVFAISPETGTLNDLYRDKVIRYFAPVNNEELIEKEICSLYEDFVRGGLKHNCASIPESDPKYVVEQYLNL